MSTELPSRIYFQVLCGTPVTSQSTLHAKGITPSPFPWTTLSKGGQKEGPEYELLAGHRENKATRVKDTKRAGGAVAGQWCNVARAVTTLITKPRLLFAGGIFYPTKYPASRGCVGNCTASKLYFCGSGLRIVWAVHFFKVEINATSIRVNWPAPRWFSRGGMATARIRLFAVRLRLLRLCQPYPRSARWLAHAYKVSTELRINVRSPAG